ncbi:hypothetical protein [Streptomyces sp. NBC_00162]|uniref:hypothetical protein n=1 Tax=Streptomyces sp. NBC_00162 TaxID=2903629 RepID=UPI00214B688E|nr:hypothetical protein [Streptomyces sp. NBC_00162]UUU41317.1 hypothetical protein JIW86_22350 [Streptomyces sp. NBC_00162]
MAPVTESAREALAGLETSEDDRYGALTLTLARLGRQETWDTLVRAVDGTDPAHVGIADKELMLKILYPPLNLFHRYLSQES